MTVNDRKFTENAVTDKIQHESLVADTPAEEMGREFLHQCSDRDSQALFSSIFDLTKETRSWPTHLPEASYIFTPLCGYKTESR